MAVGVGMFVYVTSMNKVHKKWTKQKKLEHMLLEKQKELKGTGDGLGKHLLEFQLGCWRNGNLDNLKSSLWWRWSWFYLDIGPKYITKY